MGFNSFEKQMARDAKNVERRIENTISTMILRIVLIPIFLGGMLLFAWYIKGQMNASSEPGEEVAGDWDGSSTFECKGNDKLTLSGQTATVTDSPAISATGNCELTLTDMNITAPIVIEAKGNAKVTVVGGSLTGSETAIVAGANGHVKLDGAKVTGPTKAAGAAKIDGLP